MANVTSPHDRFFRRMLSSRTTAEGFLRRFLPDSVLASFDLRSLEPLPESFVDPELRLHISDLIYRTRLRDGGDAYLYILLEHKSEPDRLVGLQILRYMSNLWHQVVREEQKRLLPPIIPLVLYHGRRRWDVPREFSDLVRCPVELNRHSPKFQYMLVDLAVEPEEDAQADPILEATLLVLKHAFSQELRKRLASILALLESVLVTPMGAEALDSVLYYVSSIGVTGRELRESLAEAFPTRGDRIMSTWLEKYIEEGVERGLQQGLLDVLLARFGGVSTQVHERIRATEDIAVLNELIKTAAIAESFEAFYATLTERGPWAPTEVSPLAAPPATSWT